MSHSIGSYPRANSRGSGIWPRSSDGANNRLVDLWRCFCHQLQYSFIFNRSFSKRDSVSADVGFYYMANAAGRLTGTLLSGIIYQQYGLTACLLGSAIMVIISSILSAKITR